MVSATVEMPTRWRMVRSTPSEGDYIAKLPSRTGSDPQTNQAEVAAEDKRALIAFLDIVGPTGQFFAYSRVHRARNSVGRVYQRQD
jgi:hypothetical protein